MKLFKPEPMLPSNGSLVGQRRHLDILGHRWRVLFLKRAPSKAMGMTTFHDQVIRVHAEMHRDQVRATLLHEVMHAGYWSMGTHPRDEERCVRNQEAVIFNLLRSPANRWLLAFVQEESLEAS